jgi:phosphoribosylformimino-5-aminoimidazole carboxamide ribotide isomerase
MGGKYVMLKQGIFDKGVSHGGDPLDVARRFAAAGAKRLHIIDLDAARTGESSNEGIIADIIRETGLFVQTGGGVRTMDDLERKLALGLARVIIGTAAVNSPDFVAEAVKRYGAAVAVGIDAKVDYVSVNGWTNNTTLTAVKFAQTMDGLGVETIIYTDISKDGMLQGVNIDTTEKMIRSVNADVIASGGVSSMEDLYAVEKIGSAGVIVGKALLTGALDLQTIIDTFEG